MQARRALVLRAVLVVASTLVISAVAHQLAGASAPGLLGLAVAAVAGLPVGMLALGRARLTALPTAIVIAATQVVFHVVFDWSASAGASSHAGHVHPVALADGVVTASTDHNMLAAHVIAGVVTLALLLLEQRAIDRIITVVKRWWAAFGAPLEPAVFPLAERVRPVHPGHAPGSRAGWRCAAPRAPPIPVFAG